MSDDYLYEPGTGLEVPGIEAVFEYGDASTYAHGSIPGSLKINDHSKPDQIRVTEISGLHDDPDVADSRVERGGRDGERAGLMKARGRTVGLTGHVRSNSVNRMRDLWRRMRAQFGRTEKDLVIHPPGVPPFFYNELWLNAADWSGATTGSFTTITPLSTATEGNLTVLQHATTLPSGANELVMSQRTIKWNGEDIWITGLVKITAAAAAVTSIGIRVAFIDSVLGSTNIVNATGTGVITTPASGVYHRLTARITSASALQPGDSIRPMFYMATPATAGAYTMRLGQPAAVLVDDQEPSPSGYFDANTPGFEAEGTTGLSRSYGPCYVVNQFRDPNCDSVTAWDTASSAGTAVDVAGTVIKSWPGDGKKSSYWSLRSPSTTSRTLALWSMTTSFDPESYVVTTGRNYRVHLRLLVREMFTVGQVYIVWKDHTYTDIASTLVGSFDAHPSSVDPIEVQIDGTGAAPSSAHRAYINIKSAVPSTVTGSRMSIQIAEPAFFDISEHDPGEIPIDGFQGAESGLTLYDVTPSGSSIVYSATGARRRIPRPFLLRKVRSLWDGKAPESQRNLMARRDFTMSLRAADPRVYVVDERNVSTRLTGLQTLTKTELADFGRGLSQFTVVAGSDNFTPSDGLSHAINSYVSTSGQTWASSGSTTDLTVTGGSGSAVTRSTTSDASPRFAILGSTSFVDQQVACAIGRSGTPSGSPVEQGVIARWVDSSNYLRAVLTTVAAGSSDSKHFLLVQRVAGTDTVVGNYTLPGSVSASSFYIKLTAYGNGYTTASLMDSTRTVTIASLEARSSSLRVGGAIASGKPGIYDYQPSAVAVSRSYSSFVNYSAVSASIGPVSTFTNEGVSVDFNVMFKNSELNAHPAWEGVFWGPREASIVGVSRLFSDSIARMYRASSSYTTPQVTIGGNAFFEWNAPLDTVSSIFSAAYVGSVWQYNYIGLILKRVSSTRWLEVRYNMAHNGEMTKTAAGAPYSLELWSSHDTTGAAAVTRLAGWDVPLTALISDRFKFVRSYMDSFSNVFVELWNSGGPDPSGAQLISRFSYTLPAGLSSTIGASISGQCGLTAKFARWSTDGVNGISPASYMSSYGSPHLFRFESVDYNSTMFLANCPVIGDADDTPVKVRLSGSITNPTIAIVGSSSSDIESVTLEGTFTSADPVTIDMDEGTIKSDSGTNYFYTRKRGSRFFYLKPGQNILEISAESWDSAASEHVKITYRDALK